MADLHQPPTKRKLPFKRTARRKSNEAAVEDSLSLFSRSGTFFEEQPIRAREKAEREEAEKAARAAKEKQKANERFARVLEITKNLVVEPYIPDPESAKKRRRISHCDNDEGGKESDDDIFGCKSSKQTSPSVPRTPNSKRDSPFATDTRELGKRITRSSHTTSTPVISLDDDDDDPVTSESPSRLPSSKQSSVGALPKPDSPFARSGDRSRHNVIALDEDEDSGTRADTSDGRKEDEEEDPSEYYVRLARERMQKAQEEREAREKEGGGVAGNDDDPVVQILIHSHLAHIHPLLFRRKLSQKLTVVYQTWIEQQVAKHSLVPRATLETMFFTWKGNKVYPHTTLQTLGIKPERDGKLYPSWKDRQEGYDGREKVLFEAWTQELYDEYLEEKEKRRLRDLGELIDDEPEERQEPDQVQNSQEDQKIRVHFKAKDRPAAKATVRSSTTTAQLIKVYRRLAEIPEDKTIELRWDGDVLDPDTTVEEAEIEDMDSLEVHIK
ncbi:hypothetical protein GGS26DRAFT_566292 [Hypomontagnella submonticulosa]|nr:hypothetical protein GGS26DRAFT_566292 [Hypomontagnella submonticulosa]